MSQIVLKLSQSDCAAFVACGEQGLTDRGVLHPLTAYAIANGIEARPLSICDNLWKDQGGSIAKRNLIPYATDFVYRPMLKATPIDFGCGPALEAAHASGASLDQSEVDNAE